MNKNDILTRLQNGETLEQIGQELANIMNAANAEYLAAEKAKAEAEAQKNAVANRKRELAEQFVTILREWAKFYDAESQEMLNAALDESDYNELVEAVDGLFDLIASLRELKTALGGVELKTAPKHPASIKISRSDDEKLADFLSSILS